MWRWIIGIICVGVLIVGVVEGSHITSLSQWLHGARSQRPITGKHDAGVITRTPVRVTVIATPARTGSLPILRRTIGTVVPLMSTAVSSVSSGMILDVIAKDGAAVKKGDLLVQLDDRELRSNVERDKGILQRDQATLDDAKQMLARAMSLTKEEAESRQQAEDALTAVKVAEATIAVDRANLATDTVRLSQMEIRAPFDGRLGAVQVSPGAFVAPGQVIVTLIQMNPMFAEFALPETDLALTRSSYVTRSLSAEVSPMLISSYTKSTSGPVTFIDNAIDPRSATFKLRALLPNRDDKLWPGQSLKVLVNAGMVDDLVLVPLVAVQSTDDGALCYVVAPDRTIQIRDVDVALRVGDQAGIVRGLKAGELVVTEGQSSLENGTPVVLEKRPTKVTVPAETNRQKDQ